MSKRWLAMVLSCAMLLGCLGGLSLFVSADESTGEVYYYDFTKKSEDGTYAHNGLEQTFYAPGLPDGKSLEGNTSETTDPDGAGEFTADGFKATKGHCYFIVNNALRTQENIGIKAYLLGNSDYANLQYNDTTGEPYHYVNFRLTNNMNYFVLNDAKFANLQNGRGDFRFQQLDERTIRRVEVYVLDKATLNLLVQDATVSGVLGDKLQDENYTNYMGCINNIKTALSGGEIEQSKINELVQALWAAENKLVKKVAYVKMPTRPGYTDGSITVDETTGAITLGDYGFFYYNGSSQLWKLLGVATNEPVDLEITLDYQWNNNGKDTGAPWCHFSTIQADGTGTRGDGFGNLRDDYHFVPDRRSTVTIARKNQLLCSDRTADTWYMKLGNAGEQTLTVYGVSFKVTKANGSIAIATLGTAPEAQSTDVKGYTVALKEDIGLNVSLSLSDEVLADSDATVRITDNGAGVQKEINVKDLAKDSSGNCSVAVELPAKAMADTVHIHVISGTYQWSTTYSVMDYAKYILDHASEETYKNAVPLVKAMLNYGSMAQVYFKHNCYDNSALNESKLANAILSADDKKIDSVDKTTLSSYNSYNKKQSENGITLKAANLSLLSKTTLRLFFDIGGKDANALTFLRDGQQLAVAQDGNEYYVEIDLAPNELAKEVAVTVAEGDETLMTATYNVMAYGYNVLRADANTYGALQNVIRALYLYNQQATTYAG